MVRGSVIVFQRHRVAVEVTGRPGPLPVTSHRLDGTLPSPFARGAHRPVVCLLSPPRRGAVYTYRCWDSSGREEEGRAGGGAVNEEFFQILRIEILC